jgi:hypothetical protein
LLCSDIASQRCFACGKAKVSPEATDRNLSRSDTSTRGIAANIAPAKGRNIASAQRKYRCARRALYRRGEAAYSFSVR